MNNKLTQRPAIFINVKESEVEAINPHLVVLISSSPGANSYLDIGSFCYTRRSEIPPPPRTACPVDPSSLDHSRIPFTKALIAYIKGLKTRSTAHSVYVGVKAFIGWIDSQPDNYPFNDTACMIKAYREYTTYLYHRINTSSINGQPIKLGTAGNLQAQARLAVTLATDLSEPEIKTSATFIKKNRKESNQINLKLPSEDSQAKTFAALINFIEEAHRILVGGGKLPLQFKSPTDTPYYMYSLVGTTRSTKKAPFSPASLLVCSPEFPSWKETQRHFNLSGDSNSLRIERSIYDKAHQRYEYNNENLRSDLRRRIGNHAIVAGMMAFMAATGCNLSVAKNLESDTLKIVPSTQGQRYSGTKGRAFGKPVFPEFGAQFSPIFRKHLEIREWVLNGKESDLVFPVASYELEPTIVCSGSIQVFKTLFTKALPKTTWVPSPYWRKNVGYQYLKLSGGDLALTAEKLSNNESTVKSNYGRPSLDDFAAEMTLFLESVHQAAIERTRFSDKISVKFIEEKRPEAVIGVGSCEKAPDSIPERAPGFTLLSPAPTCRDPENCLFCAYYALHADEEDIRRLLSLHYLLKSSKVDNSLEHWENKFGPTLHRIDEIITAIEDAGKASGELIDTIRQEIKQGALDSFWAIHFDALVIAGVIL